MNLATWSIRNPIPTVMLFALLALAGIWGFRGLPIQNLPDLDLPTVNVTLAQPGAAPAQLETQVARKVEDSLSSLSGLKHIQTTITDGQVSMVVSFVLETRLSDALIATKNAVDSVRSDLPADLQQPTVSAVTLGGDAILVYALKSPKMDEEALSWFVDDTVGKAILAVPGVGRFERVGGVDREVRVEVDPVRLAALGVTAADVSRALDQEQTESSGGKGQIGGAEQSVRTIETATRASDLDALPVVVANGSTVRLDEVATVHDDVADRSQAALLDGNPVVGFKIYRAKGSDETRIAQGVEKVLNRLKASDASLDFEQVSGTVGYTLEQYEGSMSMLYEGAFLAIIVVLIFLRDWRATLIAAAALPLSILPAFAAMSWLGYSLNTVTLLALAVIVGILVDDAIVEVENIERHSRAGKPMLQATGDAVAEIALAVVATTMTLVAVFLPTALMPGIPGLVFKQFAWTAVIAVLASLLVARLLTPLMAAHMLKVRPTKEHGDGRLTLAYLRLAKWCLKHRWTTVAGAVVFFAASIALVPLIPAGLLPASDTGYTTVNIDLPPGSSLQNTLDSAEVARDALSGVQGIAHVFTTVGDAQQLAPGSQHVGAVTHGALILTLAPRGQRPTEVAIENIVRAKLLDVPGIRFHIGAGKPGEKLELTLASDNSSALEASAQAFVRQLRGIGRLSDITTTANLDRPEIEVRPDLERAAERGVTTAAIGDAVRIATGGDFDGQVATLNLDDRQIYIRVRIPDAARQDLETLGNMRVRGKDGLVPLSSIATLSLESGPSEIDRYDRSRIVTVDADLGGTPLSVALKAAHALPAAQQLPSTVRLIQTGDAETQADLVTGFGVAMLTGLLCVFCVLVLLFKDFLQPLTILSAIPLSVGGAFLGLLSAHSELDISSMIGLIMLMGIVTKNSILLVEYAIVGMREHGLSRAEAMIDACHKRARPIVMTTVAMIAGMTPIALGLGADSSFRQPMAVAVIGGLVTSTALSLLVVPVVFTFVDQFEAWVRRRAGRSGPSQHVTVFVPSSLEEPAR